MEHPDAAIYPGKVMNGKWLVGDRIGAGGFCLVYETTDIATGAEAAIKILSQSKSDPQFIDEFEREAVLLDLLSKSSNVINMLDHGKDSIVVTSGEVDFPLPVRFIVLERATCDLATLLLNHSAIAWDEKLALFRGIAKGMHQMHLSRIVNRDLKSENVLIVENDGGAVGKLSDLGRSRNTREDTVFSPLAYQHGRGDLRFAAPELLWGLGTSDAESMRLGDLYLLGSTLFEFATGLGLTAIAIPNAREVAQIAAGLGPEQRERDFRHHVSDLKAQYEPLYAMFERELPGPMRQVGGRLLRTLTNPNPSEREPRGRYQKSGPWDLAWVLKQADILTLSLSAKPKRQVR